MAIPTKNLGRIVRPVALALLATAGLAWGAWQLPGIWAWVGLATLGLVVVAGVLVTVDMVVPGVQLLSKAPHRADVGERVALTFDDGPIDPWTPQVLDVLDAHGVKATFFCIGTNAERFPETVRAMAARGHDVQNHGFSHRLLPLLPSARIREEIARTADVLEQLTGKRPTLLRCPKGYKSRRVQRIARELGHRLVGFSYPLYDIGEPPPQSIVDRLMGRVRAGDFLLVHDGHAPHKPRTCRAVVDALPGMIEGLRAKGLEPTSLAELGAP